MPIDLQLIRASEFIRMGAHDRLNMESSRKLLTQLAKACWRRGIGRALLDLRAIVPGPTPAFTPDELASLVGAFKEIGFTKKQRLAVLYSSDPHFGARLFAFISKMRGWTVQAFNSFEAAILWLSEDQVPETAAKPGEWRAVMVKGKRPTAVSTGRQVKLSIHRGTNRT